MGAGFQAHNSKQEISSCYELVLILGILGNQCIMEALKIMYESVAVGFEVALQVNY